MSIPFYPNLPYKKWGISRNGATPKIAGWCLLGENPIYKCMLAAGVAPFDDHDFLSKPLVTTGDLPSETPMKPPWAEKKKTWAPARW